MIDICYILGRGSKFNNNEIRYSLRSIEKHLSNYRNVYIIGELPEFIKDVIHIPMDDMQICKETNIYAKVLRACKEDSISDDFLFFNDDHFLNADFDAEKFPNFYKCDLTVTIRKVRNMYRKPVLNTARLLSELKLTTLNFDIHTPIIYNKNKFVDVMTKYNWTVKHGYIVKSLYGNSIGISDGVLIDKDYKLNGDYGYERFKELISKTKIWSIGDKALCDNLTVVLNELYPMPSKWEA